MKSSLSHIKNGEFVTVREILESSLKVKLIEMGLTLGKRIQVLYRAPFGGPIAIDVEGYVLSLRKDEAQMVEVESLNPMQS
ncbi:MAG: FeoA family protein [Crocinitomicaceae bacterium]